MGKLGRFTAIDDQLWVDRGLAPEALSLDLEVTRTTVHAKSIGDGPTVVFIHGASNAGSSWIELVAQLDGFRCVVVDRPGCGRSAPGGSHLTRVEPFNAFAGDFVADVADALGEQSVSVVATSFGGYFALRGTAAHPDRIDNLVLLGWSVGAPAGAMPLVMRMGSSPRLSRITAAIPPTKGAVRGMLKRVGLRNAIETGAFTPQMVEWFQSLLRDTRTMRNEIASGPRVITRAGINPDIVLSDDQLARVKTPTLLLWGRDDPFGGEDIARSFAARLSNAALEMVDGGHAVWIDDAPGIGARVQTFLS